MAEAIPEKYRDLFSKRAFASLATLMPDGRPQVTPVWCDLEGDYVVFNSAKGRQKDRNVRRDPRVAIAIIDPDNPYRHLEVRGQRGGDHGTAALTSTSTKWPRSIWAWTSTPIAKRRKCA